MPESVVLTYWDCIAVPEKSLAYALVLQWNGVSAANLKTIMQAILIASSPSWVDTRLDAFVEAWGCSYEVIEVDGIELEFVVCTNQWVGQLQTCFMEGDCGVSAPSCRAAIGFG